VKDIPPSNNPVNGTDYRNRWTATIMGCALDVEVAIVLLLVLGLPGCAAVADPEPDVAAGRDAPTGMPFDIANLKINWKKRIDAIKTKGLLPIIDIESSFNSSLNIGRLAQSMDDYGVALIAYSHEPDGRRWSDATPRVVRLDPSRFIPTTEAGVHPFWTTDPAGFLAETKKHVLADRYPLMGEFEFRHYPSPRQYRRGAMYRDVSIPINGDVGHELFGFAEKTGVAFQIHHEIEDALLPALEDMLRRYPKAKVIWCHLAQVRYENRAATYGPGYVRRLIETHPNLYFDTAFGGPNSVYPGSGEHHARIWDRGRGRIKNEWVKLIEQHPWRFLAALDLGGDRQDQLPEQALNLRGFLEGLPDGVREIVGYKAAWKLLFGEEL